MWDRSRSKGAVVKQLWTNSLRFFWMRKPTSEARGGKEARETENLLDSHLREQTLTTWEEGDKAIRTICREVRSSTLKVTFCFLLYVKKKYLKFLQYHYISTNTLEFLYFLFLLIWKLILYFWKYTSGIHSQEASPYFSSTFFIGFDREKGLKLLKIHLISTKRRGVRSNWVSLASPITVTPVLVNKCTAPEGNSASIYTKKTTTWRAVLLRVKVSFLSLS